jgi:DNA polymerase-3 subunit epsilon
VREKLYAYLLERPSGATPRELLDLVFTQPGSDPEFGPRFLRGLLASDARFVCREPEGTWHVRAHAALAQPLSETTFVVCDLETTGMAASAAGIIEIGAARVRGGQVVGEFQQLVNPGTWLPPFITRLTGIEDAMLAGQPPIAQVWPRFVDFLGTDVLVAHNARFDLAFLNAAAAAYSGRPLSNSTLCTLKLARRLLPAVKRRGLDALASHFALPVHDRHRALGDVRITVEVLFHLLELLAARGITRLDQALDVQHHARDGRRFECPLPRDQVAALPAASGIYRFYDAGGRLLYIGKAKNLRERVSSYLSNAAGHSNKTLDLIRHSHDVRVQLTGSELEAALEEAEAIRRHQPPYNKLGKHLPRIAFLKLSVTDPYPRLSLARKLGVGRAHYVGPFRSRDEAQRVLGLLTRLFRLRTCGGRLRPDGEALPCFQGQVDTCSAPCAARVSAADYRRQVDECLTLLTGDATAAENELTRRRAEFAETLRFEAAAKTQRDLRLLQMLQRRQRILGWMTAEQHFLVLQPTADRRLVLAYAILGGRLALRERLSDESQVDALAARIREQLSRATRTTLRPDDVEGTTIVAAWLRDRGETDGCVFRLGEDSVPATQVAEWRAACASLLTNPAVLDADALQVPASQPQGQRQHPEHPELRGVLGSAPD